MKTDNIQVSLYNNKKSYNPTPTSLQWYFDAVKNGTNKEDVLTARGIKKDNPQKYQEIKEDTAFIMASCVMNTGRKIKDNIKEENGVICIDIDCDIHDQQIHDIQNDVHTLCVHRSFGGDGICVFIKIKKNAFLECFHALADYFYNTYGLSIDQSCKNVNRFRYISFDPEIYVNQDSKTWLKIKSIKHEPKRKDLNYIYSDDDFDHVLQQVKDKRIDLTEDSYDKYMRIGFSLASKFGESGRNKFHLICEQSTKYNYRNCDTQYTKCIKSNNSGVTISTLYYYAKEAGLSIYQKKNSYHY